MSQTYSQLGLILSRDGDRAVFRGVALAEDGIQITKQERQAVINEGPFALDSVEPGSATQHHIFHPVRDPQSGECCYALGDYEAISVRGQSLGSPSCEAPMSEVLEAAELLDKAGKCPTLTHALRAVAWVEEKQRRMTERKATN